MQKQDSSSSPPEPSRKPRSTPKGQHGADEKPKPADVNGPTVATTTPDQAALTGDSAVPDQSSTKRRMPEYLFRHLLRLQGGKFYLPAAQRLVWFRDECPEWGIETELIEGGQAAGFATVSAKVTDPNGRTIATALKTETKQDFPAGWVEKAETGAIARALAVAGFGTQFAPEMDEGAFADSPQARSSGGSDGLHAESDIWEGPGQCPKCHAPAGKRHAKPCVA